MRISSSKSIRLAALLLVPCWGCGPAGGANSDLIAVKGKVTFKGKPVTKGTVEFEPRDRGRPAHGELQSDGTYALTTFKEGDGVIAGKHRVSISGTGKSVRKEAVPTKYTSPNTSKLEAMVDAEHTEFSFELQ